MNWTPVKSSSLNAVSYDADKRVLAVRFNSGLVYNYDGVPPYIYKELMEAESKGKFFNKNIKDNDLFVYETVRGEEGMRTMTDHGKNGVCGIENCRGAKCKNMLKSGTAPAVVASTPIPVPEFLKREEPERHPMDTIVHRSEVRVVESTPSKINPFEKMLQDKAEASIFSEQEKALKEKRARLTASMKRLGNIQEASGLSDEQMAGCFNADQLRQKMRESGLSWEYIEKNFPDLDEDFNNQFDVQELKYQEFSLSAQKYFKSNPEKLHGLLHPELVQKIKDGTDPEEIMRIMDSKGLDAIYQSPARKRRIQEALDAGFTEDDLRDYRGTMDKMKTDKDYQEKGRRLAGKRKKKGKWAKTGTTIVGKSLLSCMLPLSLAVDAVGIMCFKKYRRPRLTKNLSRGLMRRW